MEQIIRLSVEAIVNPVDLLTKGFDEDIVLELMEDIKARGQIVPINVYDNTDGTYTRTDGGHRIEACKRLGLEVLAVVKGIASSMSAENFLVEQLSANSTRRNTNRKDFVDAIVTLNRKYGKTVSEIIETLGVSKTKVYDWLSTVNMDEDIREKLNNGEIKSIAVAKDLSKARQVISNPELLDELELASDQTAVEFADTVKELTKKQKELDKENGIVPDTKPVGFQPKVVIRSKEILISKKATMEANDETSTEAYAMLLWVLSLDEATVEEARTEYEKKLAEAEEKKAQTKAKKDAEKLLAEREAIEKKIADAGLQAQS